MKSDFWENMYLHPYLENANHNISQGISHLMPGLQMPMSTSIAPSNDVFPPSINSDENDKETAHSIIYVTPAVEESPSLINTDENTNETIQPDIDVNANFSKTQNQNESEDISDLPSLLSDSEEGIENIKIMRATIRGATFDVRTGFKAGRNFNIETGRFNNLDSITNEISEKNTGIHLGVKIKSEGKLYQDHQVLWQSNDNNNLFNPQLIWDARCVYSAECDPSKAYFDPKIKFEIGGDLRFNLVNGSYYENPYVNIDYAIDACGASASAQGVFNLNGRIKAEARVDTSLAGPSIGANLQSNELCFLGFTFQCDLTARLGIGVKATAGAGLTCDKTQPNIRGYFLLGAGAGGCAEFEVRPSVGFDTQYQQQLINEYNNVEMQPHHQKVTNSLEGSINNAKVESSHLTGWASFWNNHKINTWEESLQEYNERMYSEAVFNTGYGINCRKPGRYQ
jgi:hypothetical protein